LNYWEGIQLLLSLAGDGRNIPDPDSLAQSGIAQELHRRQAAVSFDHIELVAILFSEQGLMPKEAIFCDRECNLIGGHLVPERFDDLVLARILSQPSVP
jgi:hypothetical protein